ncbi:DUF3450 domain-containing protein [Desulfobacula toluolica]|uniref:Conserved uncharacterized protein n=1 Tax=Desulfobacula toluolica (strain DSM 7467 / Tol2) TaxID=651182 RepID=K0NJ02_DESTT|nr:DUF3450 domain-containing protein [Desulfobacula toluolica]CCK81441.1 conserved uncharacterized protein [Desulfobacula toluolica Tol2]
MYYRKILLNIIIAGLTCLIALPPSLAQNFDITSHAVRNEISKAMDVEKKIQKRVTAWTEKAADLSDKLNRLREEKQRMEKKLQKLMRLKTLEEKKHAENKRKKKEADRVRNELSDYLDSVLVKLETHIKQDLPFLMAERQARIDSLKDMMVDPTESSAEKFRRLFEALQIETEYGTTIEASQKTITFEGTQVLVNVFRLGRVSLFCQTIDKKKSGYFDIREKNWKILPEDVNRDMAKALAMARLERSVELVKLPLGRIVRP